MTDTIKTSRTVKRSRRMAREPEVEGATNNAPANAGAATSTPAKPQSKSALVLDLLNRPEGATLDQMIAATGWLPHTTRAMLTGLKKKGHIIESEKPADGARIYRVTGKAAAA